MVHVMGQQLELTDESGKELIKYLSNEIAFGHATKDKNTSETYGRFTLVSESELFTGS